MRGTIRVLEERRYWHCGTYYCDACLSADVSAAGTVYHNPQRQEWLDNGGDVDSWYCGNCGDETSTSWIAFVQFFLWDDPEAEQLRYE